MPAFLIDTHALIWWWDESSKLSADTRRIMTDSTNRILVSAATAWEIATKVRVGRLPVMAPAMEGRNFAEWVVEDGFEHLAITHDHCLKAGLLPGVHRDPFDRLIAAQGLLEDLTVITRDAAIGSFGCRTLW